MTLLQSKSVICFGIFGWDFERGKEEAQLSDSDNFNEFKIAFAEVETTFLQSKKPGAGGYNCRMTVYSVQP